MSTRAAIGSRFTAVWEDTAKLPAFFRRDFLTLWSYRAGFISDWVNLFVQVLLFYFIGQLVPSDRLPTYGGRPVTYVEYVMVALILTSFMQVSLARLVAVVRNEQLLGTLESLLVTPTAPITFQLGSVTYDVLYVPIRTAVFLLLMTQLLGASLDLGGLLPTAVILLVFLPFLWGIGVVSAAVVLAFKHGGRSLGIGVTLLTLASGAYFPVAYLPDWLERLTTRYNPVTISLDGARGALLGGAGWNGVPPVVLTVIPMAIATLAVGVTAFRFALQLERRRGTLGMY
jgi:ABC-type multidrug transport system permease subunit